MKVRLVKSLIQRKREQVATAHSLGLRKIGDVAEVPNTPDRLGLVNKIRFLIEVLPGQPAQAAPAQELPAQEVEATR